jgi:hypothetical protein
VRWYVYRSGGNLFMKKLRRATALSLLMLALSLVPSAFGQTPAQPKIFVKAEPDFAVALSAAIIKKHTPVIVVTDEKDAEYFLQSAAVSAKQESAGSKVARCLFAYCAGIEGSSTVSVQLIKVSDSSIVWAYQVRKANGGPVGIQSLSEAIAKHLKNDYLDKKK